MLKVQAVENRPNLWANTSSSFAQIDIELTDSNDNSPVFQPTNLYSFTVEALAGPGTVVGQASHLRFPCLSYYTQFPPFYLVPVKIFVKRNGLCQSQ